MDPTTTRFQSPGPPDAAIVGIGATEFSARSGRTELELACEAVLIALADAGIDPSHVDGLVRFGASQRSASELAVAHALGLGGLTYWSEVDLGGGAGPALVGHAAMAVATGAATCVVGYRALNGRSGARPGTSETSSDIRDLDPNYRDMLIPHGLTSPIQMNALMARRYLYEYSLPDDILGGVVRTLREYANNNPRAQLYGRPIADAEYMHSQMISTPLRKLDCCVQTDGGVAFVVVASSQATLLSRQPPAYIRGWVQSSMEDQLGFLYSHCSSTHLLDTPAKSASRRLYSRTGLTPADIDVAQFYDCFSITLALQLEAYGFCQPGAGAACINEGMLRKDGALPSNTAGGSFGEGYLQGVNHILEGVRQVRGTSYNQVPKVKNCLVTGGIPVPTSAVVISRSID